MIFVVILNVLGLINVVGAALIWLDVPLGAATEIEPLEIFLIGLIMILVAQLLRAYFKSRQR